MIRENANHNHQRRNDGDGRNCGRTITASKLNLRHISECPHRKLAISLVEEQEPQNKPCLNDLCFAIGEFFENMDWADMPDKQIDRMGKIMFLLDCACHNEIVYSGKNQHNRAG